MTAKAKHTPGPWRVTQEMRGLGNQIVAGVEATDGYAVANCGTDGRANAWLIAAGPAMFEAMQDLILAEGLPPGYADRAILIDAARKAIAQAKGERT